MKFINYTHKDIKTTENLCKSKQPAIEQNQKSIRRFMISCFSAQFVKYLRHNVLK